MTIFIRDNYNEMSKAAAKIIAKQIKEKPDSVIGLATGFTPIGTYRELIRMHKEEGLSFKGVTAFTLYEFLGEGFDIIKPYGLDKSSARYMHEEFFKHVDIDKKNIHYFDGFTDDPRRTCQEYEEKIKAAGGIDLQLLGIGRDGHWGYNEPGSSLGSRSHVVALTKQTIDDNYEDFYRKVGITKDEMPHFALTMGVGTILDARKLILVASGAKKAEIVQKALEGPITAQITSTAIQLYAGEATIILDADAASMLSNIEHIKHTEAMSKKYGFRAE
ncbi:MAG: glucosamine-6-phosphate deaminase [Bacilli bacterium]|jgi:glucosamine-6-phosphate deaminase|nr:glucosamine-6-phosphate deaminase [Bacillota bacterium]NLI52536.1 glucosamine-6-phosphate deaminase [Erysipelotrichaceae bacterium]OQC49304.1 MAG: Glucosamine-6-phosphate deaminase 1 [Tenericutes bacterium ADurb.Bin024]HOA11261.1 glucosamine-6-phosphate deaminase [Bacilli bacterium]TAH59437.1 MAG: glucosamine-6-phosphate deaminase [Bacillota bacterium]